MTIALPIAAALARDITERRIAEATDARRRPAREAPRRPTVRIPRVLDMRRRQPVKDWSPTAPSSARALASDEPGGAV